MALSQRELIDQGYPPRPDPLLAPQAYGRWLAEVTLDVTIVPAGTACFSYTNATTGTMAVPMPASGFSATTAEAILERQFGPKLPSWTSASIEFQAWGTDAVAHNLETDPYTLLSMYGDSMMYNLTVPEIPNTANRVEFRFLHAD
jgi:hypothetical protein